jgi:hypothetical protein
MSRRLLSRNHVFGDISPTRLCPRLSADVGLSHGLVFTFLDVTSFFRVLRPAPGAAWIGTKGDCGLRKSGGRLLGVAVMVGSCGKSAVGSGQWKVNSAIAGPSTGRAGGSHTHKKTGRGSGPLPAFLSWGGCSNGPFESPGGPWGDPTARFQRFYGANFSVVRKSLRGSAAFLPRAWSLGSTAFPYTSMIYGCS